VHEQFSAKRLAKLRMEHPDAEVLAHPECDQAVLDQADFIASTTGIIERAVSSPAKTLIIATEDGVFHQIQKRAPEKTLIQAPGMDESCACNQCPFMRLNTLEKLYLCLRDLSPQVDVPEEIRVKALVPIQRMLEPPSRGTASTVASSCILPSIITQPEPSPISAITRFAQSTSSGSGLKTFFAMSIWTRVQRPRADAAQQERGAELVLAGDRVLDVAEGAVVGADAVGGAGVHHARQRVVPRVLLRGDARRVGSFGSGSVRTR
jgi:hypothetical protein